MNEYLNTQPTTQPTGPQWSQEHLVRPAAGPVRSKRTTRMVVGALTVSAVALAGAAAAMIMAISSPAAAHSAAPVAPPTPAVTPVGPAVPIVPDTPSHPTYPVAPTQPSVAITTLQQELGQLNYYEGPVNGLMSNQLKDAITYLQRDAGLPQTGVMDSATSAALASMLVTGNNTMAG